MLAIGTRVNGPHGLGTIARYNGVRQDSYVAERVQEAATMAAAVGALDALVGGFYSGDRYPYVVRFDTGYEDVYSDCSLEEVR